MKVIRIINAIIIVVCILFTIFVGKQKLLSTEEVKSQEYKGIITIWHIDSFEGGIGSRKQFLLRSARSFEKKNTGVLVMVINHTLTSLNESIKNNEFPDMISFGNGAEITGMSEITPKKHTTGGIVGGKVYATAWARGGYVLIANKQLVDGNVPDILPELLVSQAEYTQPIIALKIEGIKAEKVTVKKPMDAYVEFVAGKTPYFLGTQRDINRLENRGVEVDAKPLEKFNDLYQYMSITSTDQLKRYCAEKFLEHLISDEEQKQLNRIGMLSPYTFVEYQNAHLSAMQKCDGFATFSAFTPAKILEDFKNNYNLILGDNEEYKNKIKNMLV